MYTLEFLHLHKGNHTIPWCKLYHAICANKANCREIKHMHALTRWDRLTHIYVSQLNIIGSNNDLSPGRHQDIISINAVILIIRTLGANFCEILSEISIFSFNKMHLKTSSEKCLSFCLGLNVWDVLHRTDTYRRVNHGSKWRGR